MQHNSEIPLDTVLAYENPSLIQSFARDFGLSLLEASNIFTETKKWLWLCTRHDRDLKKDRANTPPDLPIRVELQVIDEMWHAFILRTREYSEFCTTYLGYFLHHTPLTGTARAVLPASEKEHLQKYVNYIFQNLGEETALLWFRRYAVQYESRTLARLKFRAHNLSLEDALA